MAMGIPVIALNFPLYRSIVEAYDVGYCVEPGDIKELAARLNDFAKDPELRSTMSARARSVCEARFSWSNELEKLLEFYER